MARKAAAKKDETPVVQGRFCPHCQSTLNLSKFRRYYCPNAYPPRGATAEQKAAFVPCVFKGYAAGASTAINHGEDIPTLATPSDEQIAIMERCERWN